MTNTKKIIRNTCIYLALIIGYIYIYVVDVSLLMDPDKPQDVNSKIEFVYSQF